jgi:hypothetical protein
MLLDDLVEASVVQLHELGQVVHIGDDIAEVLFEQHKVLLARALLAGPAVVETSDHVFDLALADRNPSGDLHRLDLLLGMHLVELGLETLDESALVLLGPLSLRRLRLAVGTLLRCPLPGTGLRCSFILRSLLGGGGPARALEGLLQAVVVDVVPLVLADDARPELLAKLHHDDARSDRCVGVSAAV